MEQDLQEIHENWGQVTTDIRSLAKIKEFLASENQPSLEGWTSLDIAQLIKQLQANNEKVNMIFIGPPKSGKSTLCEKLLHNPNKKVEVNHESNRKTTSSLIESHSFSVYDGAGVPWKHKGVISWLEKQDVWTKSGIRLVFVFTSTNTVNQSETDIKKDYAEVIKYLLKKGAIVFLVGTKLRSAVSEEAYDTLLAENEAILQAVLAHYNQKGNRYTFDPCPEPKLFKGNPIQQWRCKKLGLYGCMIDSRRGEGMDNLLDMVKAQLNTFSILELLLSRGEIGAESFVLCVSSFVIELSRLTGGNVLASKASEKLYAEYNKHYDFLMEKTHEAWVRAGKMHLVNVISEQVNGDKKASESEEKGSTPTFDPNSMFK